MEFGAQFELGRVLSRTVSIFIRSFFTLMAIGILIYSPYIAIQILLPNLLAKSPGNTGLFITFLATFLPMFLGPLLTAAVTVDVLERLRGRTATMQKCIQVGFARLLPVIIVNLIVTVLTAIGMILLVLPMLIPLVFFIVAIPICVIEQKGILESLGRSAELTRGARWPILGILLLLLVLYGIVFFPMMLLWASIGMKSVVALNVFSSIMTVVAAAFQAVLAGVIYHELRTTKEGASEDELLEVFS